MNSFHFLCPAPQFQDQMECLFEALKTLERGSRSSSGLSVRLGSSFRAEAGSVSISSEGSSSGVGNSLSVCVTSLTGLF